MKTETKNCQNCKKDFIIEPDDFGFYEKMKVPVPEECPECRQKLRTCFRNFKTLYKRPSSKSGEMMVSVYHPDTKLPIYNSSEWWSDDWDPISYGIDLDPKKAFFDQVKELFYKVPRLALWNIRCENCQYSVDNLYLFKCESCYECIDCLGSTKLFYSQECESCVDSIGLFDCRNCLNCIGCVGQVNKSYHIFNKSVTKEEYKEFLSKHPLNKKESIEYILKERDLLRREIPQRSFFGSHNNDVSGNHIFKVHNIHHSFDIKTGENSKFCYTVREAIDSYDISFTGNLSESYQCLTILGSNKVIGSQTIVDSHDVFFSEGCFYFNKIFGCYGLRKKSYCILNKQYSKEEYETKEEE